MRLSATSELSADVVAALGQETALPSILLIAPSPKTPLLKKSVAKLDARSHVRHMAVVAAAMAFPGQTLPITGLTSTPRLWRNPSKAAARLNLLLYVIANPPLLQHLHL